MPTIFRLLLLIFTISFLQGCFAEKYLREIPGLGKDPEPMVADEDSSEPVTAGQPGDNSQEKSARDGDAADSSEPDRMAIAKPLQMALASYEAGNLLDSKNYFKVAYFNLTFFKGKKKRKFPEAYAAFLTQETKNQYNLEEIYREVMLSEPEIIPVPEEEAETAEEDIEQNGKTGGPGRPEEMGVQEDKVVDSDTTGEDDSGEGEGDDEEEEEEQIENKILSQRQLIEREMKQLITQFGENTPNQEEFDNLVKRVEKYIAHFLCTEKHCGRNFFLKGYYRMGKYMPMMSRVFKEKNLPPDLIYMAFQESGFNYRAGSWAGAKGIWQFMKGTGRRYGLSISRYYDQRYDPLLATVAAREYLLDLIAIFGSRSFMLAMASYNAGEFRVQRCLRKLEDPFSQRTFWHINQCLARETRGYVPSILAISILSRYPQHFGMQVKTCQDCTVVEISQRSSLTSIAAAAEINLNKIYRLNPELKGKSSTPVSNFPIYIPGTSLAIFQKNMKKVKKLAAFAPDKCFTYRVKSKQNIGRIARNFSVPARNVQLLRRSKSKKLRIGDRLRICGSRLAPLHHKIKWGENLSVLAHKYRVSIQDIKSWNHLRGSRIFKGQKLVIYIPRANFKDKKQTIIVKKEKGKKTKKRVASTGKTRIKKKGKTRKKRGGRASCRFQVKYKVQKGDSLWDISYIFGINYRKIIKSSRLKSGKIMPGQMLTICPTNKITKKNYRVKKGDVLSTIAQKLKVSASMLKRLNKIGKNQIVNQGQILIYYR